MDSNIKSEEENKGEEISIPIEDAARWLFRNILPFSLISLVPFFLVFGWSVFDGVSWGGVLYLLLFLIIGIAIHELLHAFVFGLFAKGGFKSISFGVEPVTKSPWCHCKGEMTVLAYRVGALLPFFVMGLFPLVYAYIITSPGWLFFGYFYAIGGGGDWVSAFLTRELKWTDIVRDHPSELGFYVVKRSS